MKPGETLQQLKLHSADHAVFATETDIEGLMISFWV